MFAGRKYYLELLLHDHEAEPRNTCWGTEWKVTNCIQNTHVFF